VFPIMYIVFLFVGRGRTPYDPISGTIVIQEVQAGLDRSAAERRAFARGANMSAGYLSR
jgi:hypothetical protein